MKHFENKSAIQHVIEKQASGKIAASEIHGTEISGPLSAATDACRETALVLALITLFQVPLLLFGLAFLVWKVGRAGWLGWFRLERLHRVLEQEQWEIEHNQEQEREELKELYEAKGFTGQLLEDVIDTLMADGDRLLRVMIEEELGLSLDAQEHPLKQAIGAGLGSLIALLVMLVTSPLWGAGTLLALSSLIAAKAEGNRPIPAMIWNIGIGALSFGTLYFLQEWL